VTEAGAAAASRTRRSRHIQAAAVITVAVFALLAFVFRGRFGEDPRAVASPLVGRPAPLTRLPKLDGPGDMSLADLKGSVVVVNFWASWCVPCRAEHGQLAEAAKQYSPEGVRFVGIVYQDQAGAARSFLDQFGRSYDNLTDPGSRAAIDFGLFGVPETFFIDRNGVIAGKVAGPVNLSLIATNVDRLLG
jgi:cytochrome c biogenesis protein CcmG/thiol:disulfide interchange protein DsbE